MMKKYLSGTLLLGLCALAAAFATSCAKQGGPLSPDLNLLGAGNGSNTNLEYIDGASWPGSVSQTAQVHFYYPVDTSTVVKNSTVFIYTQDDSGTSETRYDDYNISWTADKKTMIVTPSNGAWANDRYYHAVMTIGVRSASGAQIDGNGNGVPESAEFDNAHAFCTIGSPATAPGYNSDANAIVRATSYFQQSNSATQNTFSFGNSYSVDNYYANVTLTVRFAMYDGNAADFQMDANTFFINDATLHSNVVLIDQNNAPVTPAYVEVTSTAAANDTLRIAFSPAPNTKYKFKLRGGLTGIRSSNDSSLVLLRGFYFSGHGHSRAYAQDDTEYVTFQTVRDDGSTTPAVWVTTGTTGTSDRNLRRLRVVFNVPCGDGTLDPATVNTTNFMLYASTTGKYYTPSNVVLNNASYPNPEVFVYVPVTIDPSWAYYSGSTLHIHIVVNNKVRASDGSYIDQDQDGVTGEDHDAYTGATYYDFTNSYSGSTTTGDLI